jgi:hypothetical protein
MMLLLLSTLKEAVSRKSTKVVVSGTKHATLCRMLPPLSSGGRQTRCKSSAAPVN